MDATLTTTLPVFVYGTLRNGQGNYGRLLRGRTADEQLGTVAGVAMYNRNGGFPYSVVTNDPSDVIVGELMTPKADEYADVLDSLDWLEGYTPGSAFNHYDRIEVTVTLATGEQVTALMYVAGSAAADRIRELPRIDTGDWLNRF